MHGMYPSTSNQPARNNTFQSEVKNFMATTESSLTKLNARLDIVEGNMTLLREEMKEVKEEMKEGFLEM